ncbi:type IV secretory system conjugative DNA transfer family protein [Sphingobacterium siyangense]|uniref:type IV secretory system conjugative DNA transfer family protein n=1 Tax=Sphingobacterium siyangense TaxID=459529 RepID=UPI003DA3AC04
MKRSVNVDYGSMNGRNKPSSPKKDMFERLGISKKDVQLLLRHYPDFERRNATLVFFVGLIFTPISLIGALLGFVRSYRRLMEPNDELPALYPMKSITRLSMIAGAILAWLLLIGIIGIIVFFAKTDLSNTYFVLTYLVINLVLSSIAFASFNRWQARLYHQKVEERKFGSARFAKESELEKYKDGKGIYIGGGYYFSGKGHICTTAGTRGGKGTNLIIPNLLGMGEYEGSWVVIDPKAENAAITSRYQREAGRNVVLLNPWGMFTDRLGDPQSFNPLDILDIHSIHLVDDVQMIAEMIIPLEKDSKNRYFSDNARTIVTAILLHIVVNLEEEERHLGTLYRLVRLNGENWFDLLAEMQLTENPLHQELMNSIAQEVIKLMQSGENSFGSIIATVLQGTDFLKSPSLQAALRSDFDPMKLSSGRYSIYVIIPVDKLQSHSRWLRLVVTSLIRAVIRNPGKQVTYLLDEFAALGYLPEIETALSTYAGYNVTVWPILQSLIQLKNNYGNNWETFIANTAVRHFFNINDNFSADYVSSSLGQTTNIVSTGTWITGKRSELNQRSLVTPDEVRRHSQHHIFTFIGDAHPTILDKRPYYTIPELADRAVDNPYMKN